VGRIVNSDCQKLKGILPFCKNIFILLLFAWTKSNKNSRLSKNMLRFYAGGIFSQYKAWKSSANQSICRCCVLLHTCHSHIPPSRTANIFFWGQSLLRKSPLMTSMLNNLAWCLPGRGWRACRGLTHEHNL